MTWCMGAVAGSNRHVLAYVQFLVLPLRIKDKGKTVMCVFCNEEC